MAAWKQLQRVLKQRAAMAEVPVAQLSALMANINRDPNKSKAFKALDFCVFHEQQKDERGQLSPQVAAVALALRHEQRAPKVLLAAWTDILEAANDTVKAPSIRALHSDDEKVWVLAPQWEGSNIRGGLVAVHGQIHGTVRLRDADRPLMVYDVTLPKRPNMGYLEAGLLLAAA
jgi:hypothetical protein